jgi:hypothetical protein
MSGPGFIAEESEQACQQCGVIAECRPYGPNDEQICFDCAMATPESKAITEKKMARYIFGDDKE